MDKLIWKTEVRDVKDLILWKQNPRKISKVAMEKLKEKIIRNGFHSVIVIDTDNTILSGNQRKAALLQLGIHQVHVLVPNRKLSEAERCNIALASNINDGDWDFELLKDFDIELLADVGFSEVDLANIWDDNISIKEESFDFEKELKNIQEPRVKTGDIIVLGKHKIICGDSTDPEVLKKLFEDKQASMIYSDPIYNINLDYDKGLGGKQSYGGTVTDKKTDEEYKEFLKRSMLVALSVSKKDVHVFYWNTEQHIWIIQTLYRELGIDNKRVCLWVKNGHNPTPQVAFNKCYEPCIYGAKGHPYLSKKEQGLTEIMNKEITTGNDSIDEVNIWTAKRVSPKDYKHATTKPVELHEKAIRRCTLPGDIILDSFLGSGSTLIAAEQLKRVVYGVEMEPVFCDLIINRYEKLTGTKAQIISYEKTS
jgi:DNA modification methylase